MLYSDKMATEFRGIFNMSAVDVTLNFGLLTSKSNQFIIVPKCSYNANLVVHEILC